MKKIIGIAAVALAAAASQAWAQAYPNKPVHVIISFSPGSSTDIVNAAKAKPGAINWGHAGVGSGTHLNTEKFVDAAKINVTQVPFKGTPEVIQAMLSQSVDCYWAPISAAIPHIKGGRVRPLAVSTAKRNGQLPDVPTTGEAGVKGADAPLWFAVWGPAGIPAGIVNKISADTRKALKDPAVRDRLVGLGNDTMDMSPEEFKIFVRSEVKAYARVVKAAGIQPQGRLSRFREAR